MRNYRGRFASSYASVGIARRELVKFAASHGFADGALSDLENAVGEALANAAEHGHRDGGDIAIEATFAGDTLVIDIEDRGAGFSHWNASDERRPPPAAGRGFGIFLMRELMDTVEYSANGTHVRLTKRRPD